MIISVECAPLVSVRQASVRSLIKPIPVKEVCDTVNYTIEYHIYIHTLYMIK